MCTPLARDWGFDRVTALAVEGVIVIRSLQRETCDLVYSKGYIFGILLLVCFILCCVIVSLP